MLLFYTGKPRGNGAPISLPAPSEDLARSAEGYIPDEGLVKAINVAILLGQPLLLTGEPGTGKTQFATSLAAELGLGPVLRFDTKSTSVAKDLFYTVDAIGQFRASQSGRGSQHASDYITYNALGKAVLLAQPYKAIRGLVPGDFECHPEPKRSVVLIDEIDKAPRDFPNDILGELEEMYFRVPELENAVIKADSSMRPIVVLTSNSEKHLPDAFLRRCVYYDIPFPSEQRLVEIVQARLGTTLATASGDFVTDAVKLFRGLRGDDLMLQKKPSTAELIGWIHSLRSMAPDNPNPIRERKELIEGTISVLVKNRADFAKAQSFIIGWVERG